MRDHVRVLRASAYGNFMESLDFTLYAFFAVAIGRNFFPASDPLLSTMASYATFAAGFVARPIGAYVFGRTADRVGRKQVLIVTLLLMGLATALVVFAPSHQTGGLVGPIMVIAARLLAGFSAAGEIGAAAAMAIESAHPRNRGRWGGLFSSSTYLGVAAGGLIAMLCYAIFGTEQTNQWAWRVGYALGLLIVPLGWWARRNVHVAHQTAPAVSAGAGKTLMLIACAAGLTAFGSAVFYVVIMFMPVYASTRLSIPLPTGMAIALGASLWTAVFAVVGGWLSDVHGRKTVMNIALVLTTAVAWPLFLWLIAQPSAPLLAVFQWVCAIGLGAYVGGSLPLMVESFNPSQRALGVGMGYSVGVMIFGALAPVINTLALTRGVSMAPLYYLTGAAVISSLSLAIMQEPLRRVQRDEAVGITG